MAKNPVIKIEVTVEQMVTLMQGAAEMGVSLEQFVLQASLDHAEQTVSQDG